LQVGRSKQYNRRQHHSAVDLVVPNYPDGLMPAHLGVASDLSRPGRLSRTQERKISPASNVSMDERPYRSLSPFLNCRQQRPGRIRHELTAELEKSPSSLDVTLVLIIPVYAQESTSEPTATVELLPEATSSVTTDHDSRPSRQPLRPLRNNGSPPRVTGRSTQETTSRLCALPLKFSTQTHPIAVSS